MIIAFIGIYIVTNKLPIYRKVRDKPKTSHNE